MKSIKKVIIIIVGVALSMIYSYNSWDISVYDTNIDSSTYTSVGELTGEDVVKQAFLCESNGLESVEVMMQNPGNESDAVYHWGVKEKTTGKLVGEGYFNANEIKNEKKTFAFEKVKDSKEKQYIFFIDIVESDSEHGISVMKTAASKEQKSMMSLNGETLEEVLVLTQNVKHLSIETAIVFLGLYCYVILFMTFLTKIFK